MKEAWFQQLHGLPLTPTEQETVQRLVDQPQGRAFLPVAEILLKYGIQDDATQLLLHGIQLHPGYSVARVVLGGLLLRQGMPHEAWQILENAPNSLRDNSTAQILRFKLALILGHEDLLPVLRQEMTQRDQFDQETRELADQLQSDGFQPVRYGYLNQLRAQGVPLPLDFLETARGESSPAHSGASSGAGQGQATAAEEDSERTRKRRIEGFFVTPLDQIFTKPSRPMPGLAQKDMDAMTLAQVYRRQGHYEKSLDILKRLLYMAPNNELLRKQVAELRSLKEEQERREREFDPELADRMDEVAHLDQRIRTLTTLLEELDHDNKQKDL
jgi:tetratricopeptide (TPR) repeat protein